MLCYYIVLFIIYKLIRALPIYVIRLHNFIMRN